LRQRFGKNACFSAGIFNLKPRLYLRNIRITLWLYGLFFGVFFLLRFLLFTLESERLSPEFQYFDVLEAFLMGFRFDVVMAGYLLIFPYALLSLGLYFPKIQGFTNAASQVFI
jgi:hypothetical protein